MSAAKIEINIAFHIPDFETSWTTSHYIVAHSFCKWVEILNKSVSGSSFTQFENIWESQADKLYMLDLFILW